MCHVNVDIRSWGRLGVRSACLCPLHSLYCFYPTVFIKANRSFSEEVLKKLWTNSKLLALKQVNTYIAFSNVH